MTRSPQRFVCIHGHFYQPPRENPWTGRIERQETAAPYHDWNERITAECYEPNTRAWILGPANKIVEVVNNYSKISFNFGPTLLRWMERASPEIYRTILEADRISLSRWNGHGSAMAQAYHHSILPLADRKDKVTEIHWGIRDFESRYQRRPEGIWLPETAVDLETLGILAEKGLKFTILSPWQAARVRPSRTTSWKDVNGGGIDTRNAYRVRLPNGKSLALFFYNGELARGVAFQGLLSNGEEFARKLATSLEDAPLKPQLAHIATDGESYGHHHKFGEMALAYALRTLEADRSIELTVYGDFLEKYPPSWEVEINESTSWSCAHGIERWRSDCSCQTGALPGWDQRWRTPLRDGLNCLRNTSRALFESEARKWLHDPWAARDDYIEVVLDPSTAARNAFVSRWSRKSRVSAAEKKRIFALLESQRHALMMFTSCGWFFSDISGIETVQILRYAARLIEFCRELFDVDLEEPLLEHLSRAKSNHPEEGSGREIYLTQVLPRRTPRAPARTRAAKRTRRARP